MVGLYAHYDGRRISPFSMLPRQRDLAADRREAEALAAAQAEQLRQAQVAAEEAMATARHHRTLVLYSVHHDESPLDGLHRENLAFFLEVAVNSDEEAPLVDYVFFVPPLPPHPPAPFGSSPASSSGTGRRRIPGKKTAERRAAGGESLRRRSREQEEEEVEEQEEGLPYTLPVFPKAANVRVVHRPQTCLGTSGLAELLQEQDREQERGAWRLELDVYEHFVLLDSSVRGPFLPRYIHRGRRGSLKEAAEADPWTKPQPRRPWTTLLTDRLGGKGDVALVGPTVSCEQELHVQAPVWATDRAGLQLLLVAGAMDCVTAEEKAGPAFKERHELAATRAVMAVGRGLDCLMLRYRGANLTQMRADGVACTGGDDPTVPFRNDGLPVNPLEVVFIAARPHLLASDPLLRRYTEYALGRVPIGANDFDSPRVQAAVAARKARLVQAARACGAELDARHMLARCPECKPPEGQTLLDKFVREHFAQGYDYRFILPSPSRDGGDEHQQHDDSQCASFVKYNAPDLSA